jgi:hypothetical protein
MRCHLRTIVAALAGLIAMSGGCAGSGGGSDGLIRRHLSLEHWGYVEGYDANPMVLVIRDADCWSAFVGSGAAWYDQTLRDEALDVDFETEMVLAVAVSGGCSIDCQFVSATMSRDRMVVRLLIQRGPVLSLLQPCIGMQRDAVVVPRSGAWVEIREWSSGWPFPFTRTYYAAESQGTCTQPAE